MKALFVMITLCLLINSSKEGEGIPKYGRYEYTPDLWFSTILDLKEDKTFVFTKNHLNLTIEPNGFNFEGKWSVEDNIIRLKSKELRKLGWDTYILKKDTLWATGCKALCDIRFDFLAFKRN